MKSLNGKVALINTVTAQLEMRSNAVGSCMENVLFFDNMEACRKWLADDDATPKLPRKDKEKLIPVTFAEPR